MTSPDHDGFVRIARALRPYLDELVIAGAWCHRLLHFHPLATPPLFTALMTEDADVATPERLPVRVPSLDAALTAGGFRPSMTGSGRLPVMKYLPADDDSGMYVEFIAPLRGSGYTRTGEPDDILAVAGITAQKLRYVDLLLFEPWPLELVAQQGFAVGTDKLVLRVANPASYLAQKVLTLRKRHAAKKPKDALYLHDTLAMFGGAFAELSEPAARVLERLPRATKNEFHLQRVELFRDDALMIHTADIAASTGRANPPSPTTIRDVCTAGLQQLFAP